MNRKLTVALCIYVLLAVGAGFALDGRVRILTWLILGVFALKSVLWSIRQGMD